MKEVKAWIEVEKEENKAKQLEGESAKELKKERKRIDDELRKKRKIKKDKREDEKKKGIARFKRKHAQPKIGVINVIHEERDEMFQMDVTLFTKIKDIENEAERSFNVAPGTYLLVMYQRLSASCLGELSPLGGDVVVRTKPPSMCG